MALTATPLEHGRNEDGVAAVIEALGSRFGERFSTGAAMRTQHANTLTWLGNQPPDAVVFPESTEELQEVVPPSAIHHVPVIAFGTGTSLEGHVNAT